MVKRIEYTNELPREVKRDLAKQLLSEGFTVEDITAFFLSRITQVEDSLLGTEYRIKRSDDYRAITIEKVNERVRITPKKFLELCDKLKINHIAMIDFINERNTGFEKSLHMLPTDEFIGELSCETDISVYDFTTTLRDSEIDNGYTLNSEFTGFKNEHLFYGLSKQQYIERLKHHESDLILEVIKIIMKWYITEDKIKHVFESEE